MSANQVETIIQIVGLIVILVGGGVLGWMIGSGHKRWELQRAKAAIRRAHRLADRWEEVGTQQSLANKRHAWDELRYELTLGDDDWWEKYFPPRVEK